MEEWITISRAVACSQALLQALAIWSLQRVPSLNLAASRVAGLLALGITAYFLAPLLPGLPAPMFTMVVVELVGLAAGFVPLLLFWFFWLVFEERPPGAAWLLGLSAVYGLMLLFVCVQESSPGLDRSAWILAVQLIKLFVCGLALALLARGQDDDLLQERRRLRRVLLLMLGLAILTVVLVEWWYEGRVEPALELFGMVLFATGLLILNLLVLRRSALLAGLLAGRPLPDAQPAAPLDQAQAGADDLAHSGSGTSARDSDRVAALTRAMEDDRLYARHDLRVGTLADYLGLPEHRLRRLINGQLGHRNFNRFINGYRLAEAKVRLRREPDTPVLTIALDVGFRSISAFNSAFREATGTTPTAYRGLPESEYS